MHRMTALVLAGLLAAGTTHAAVDPGLIATVKPAVVTVNLKKKPNDPLDLPGYGWTARDEKTGLIASGTGFVVDGAGGLIVTAEFVLEGAEEIVVTTADGRSLSATLVGRDAMSGVAVLNVADTTLPALDFCQAPPRMGEEVVVIGNAYQLGLLAIGGTVAGNDVALKNTDMSPVMVLDLAMHKGTAGAPVVSPQGCVTGMAVALYSTTGEPYGSLGMALPGGRVQALSRELIKTGKISRSWIGISLFDEDLTLSDVTPGGPADKAGLKTGDIVLSYDGIESTTFEALRSHIAAKPIGSEMVLKVKRRNEELTFTMLTVSTPDQD